MAAELHDVVLYYGTRTEEQYQATFDWRDADALKQQLRDAAQRNGYDVDNDRHRPYLSVAVYRAGTNVKYTEYRGSQ
jgi:hypothetical protein